MSKANIKSMKGNITALKDATCVFHGVRFDVYSVLLPGNAGQTVKRDVVVHPGAVVILPILDSNRIIMIKNERFAVGKTLWELPAGTLEPAEPPIETAGRELIEETGYKAQVIEHLTSFYTTPGICNEIMHAYVAKGLEEVGQHLDENERITVEALTWKKVESMVKDGTICDGKTISTLLYYRTFI